MPNLSPQQIHQLQDKYLGKRVEYNNISGDCTFIGYNSHLPSWGLQLTIERTPIQHVDPTKIKFHIPKF